MAIRKNNKKFGKKQTKTENIKTDKKLAGQISQLPQLATEIAILTNLRYIISKLP